MFGKRFPESAVEAIQSLFNSLNERKIEYYINKKFVSFLTQHIELKGKHTVYVEADEINEPVNFLLSIGGDGTLLDTITAVGDSKLPIVGLNTGRMGFLAYNAKNEINSMLDNLQNGDYKLQRRSLLQAKTKGNVFGNFNFALNELTIHKKDSSSMMTVNTYIDGECLNSYWSDGLIISTPTGSTAYSLSCGGPIVLPGSKNFIINPIAPHNLTARPVVIPDDVQIKLKVEGRDPEFLATLDSRTVTISNSTEIYVTKAPFYINLVQFENQSFLNTLRKKMHWGTDVRN
ncbi:MAG: NAD kinase [Flavobacteriales bacterium]|nr:NAD kinase [Flavobacteriales bacterium]